MRNFLKFFWLLILFFLYFSESRQESYTLESIKEENSDQPDLIEQRKKCIILHASLEGTFAPKDSVKYAKTPPHILNSAFFPTSNESEKM